MNNKNKQIRGLIVSSLFLTLTSTIASANWNPILGLGIGNAIFTQVGESQSFAIQNSSTGEFYNYIANDSTQTATLFHGLLGIEKPLSPLWIFQTDVHYLQTSSFSVDGNFTQGSDLQSSNSYGYSYDVLTRQLLLEGKLLYTIKKRFHPYVMAGLGASFNKAYNYSTTAQPSALTPMYADNTTSSFSYALGAGFDTNLNSHLRLGLGYRFTDLGKIALGAASIGTGTVSGSLSQSNVYANEILGQLTWII
jgi:opacity protein-like surface antigen